MVETVELVDSNGKPVLWRERVTIGGHVYTAEVIQHWFAGHGVVPGRYRWTVWFESDLRPIMGQGVEGDQFAARRAAELWITEHRVAVAGR